VAFLAFAVALLGAAPASACFRYFGENPDWDKIEAEQFRDAHEVLVLRLDRVDANWRSVGDAGATFAVLRRFKGDASGSIEVGVGDPAGCGPELIVGKRYVAYIRLDDQGRRRFWDDSYELGGDPAYAEFLRKLQVLADKARGKAASK
jgi:hypothetical protein